MAKKYFCDRCGKEIENLEEDDFGEMFKEVSSAFGNEKKIYEPHLCPSCQKGFDKIIKETNDKIEKFLKNK